MRKTLAGVTPTLMMMLLALPWLLSQYKVEITSRIWTYESLCDFADPPHSSGFSVKYSDEKVTTEVTNCTTLAQKHAHPAAVCVTLKNRTQAPMDVLVDKDVSVVSKDSGAVPALARRAMVEGPMGGTKMEFVTKVTSSYTVKLAAGQEVNIVYLFPKAKSGDVVNLGKIGTAVIK